mgnify:CR=1 FL=1
MEIKKIDHDNEIKTQEQKDLSELEKLSRFTLRDYFKNIFQGLWLFSLGAGIALILIFFDFFSWLPLWIRVLVFFDHASFASILPTLFSYSERFVWIFYTVIFTIISIPAFTWFKNYFNRLDAHVLHFVQDRGVSSVAV